MLLKMDTLEAVRDGRVTSAFRRWKRPTVRSGGTLLTALGELEIRSVVETAPADLGPGDARAAGFESLDALLAACAGGAGRRLYRIDFGALRPDPRTALREAADLGSEEIDAILTRLRRMDQRSSTGPWTRATLEVIADHPEVRAGDLCEVVGQEKARFKTNVRKLKGMGLTESLGTGYRLSPRGRVVWHHLRERRDP